MTNSHSQASRRKRIAVTGLAIAAASVAAIAGAGGPVATSVAAGRSVTLKDVTFSPARLTISKGTTVTFRWRDDGTEHNVTSTGKKRFKSIGDRSSGEKPVRFAKAGTYRYVCTLHPGMSGQITVR